MAPPLRKRVKRAVRSAVLRAALRVLARLPLALALALGAAAGWYVVVQMFELAWAPDWSTVALTLSAGAGLILVAGLIGRLPALSARPSRALRTL